MQATGGGLDIEGKARVAVEQIESMQASAKDRLLADLGLLREESGHPSLSQLAQLSQGEFSKNTIDDHLSGRRTSIPSWRTTSAFVQACHEFAKTTRLSIDRLGTIEEWKVRWRAAQEGDVAAASPIRDSKSAATYSMLNIEREPIMESPAQTLAAAQPDNYFGTTEGITVTDESFRIGIERLKQSLPATAGILVVVNNSTIGACFKVSDDLLTIGRSPESSVILNDPTVSRRHAVIHRYGTAFTVRDVGSRNGTYLHQIKLTKESPLPSNEELQIGVFRLRFVQGTRTRD